VAVRKFYFVTKAIMQTYQKSFFTYINRKANMGYLKPVIKCLQHKMYDFNPFANHKECANTVCMNVIKYSWLNYCICYIHKI